MLITKHIMFVGFSLRDEAFNEIAATVRRSLKPTEAAAESGDAPRSIGTALTLSDRPFLSELWPDLECVAMIDGVKDEEDEEDEAVQGQGVLMSRGARARKLEVFLDRVCLEARSMLCIAPAATPLATPLATPCASRRDVRDEHIGLFIEMRYDHVHPGC